ncbi:MAG: response regulator [bacterium]|nr:response regulator [bacterium]
MPPRVLYIEDEPDMLELVRLILSRRGMEYHAASGGIKGVELVNAVSPDLILLDLMMPDMDGWEVYDYLKATPQHQDTPVIIVTARAQSDERLQQVRAAANADDYIIKPFGPSQLLDVIDRVLNRTNSAG